MNSNKSEIPILISVVTVVYNGVNFIEDTILSVTSQSYSNIEYIVIDGGSIDGTIDIINSYSNKISKIIVERDNGIYDAMNKSLQFISGSYVIFMNAGDKFYSTFTLSNLLNIETKNAAIIFGGVVVDFDKKFQRYLAPKKLNQIFKGMVFSHQSVLIKVDLLKTRKYDLNFNITADYDFFLGAYITGETFFEADEIVSTVVNNGLSDNNHLKACLEKIRVLKKYDFPFNKIVYLRLELLIILFKELVKYILPSSVISKIKKNKI